MTRTDHPAVSPTAAGARDAVRAVRAGRSGEPPVQDAADDTEGANATPPFASLLSKLAAAVALPSGDQPGSRRSREHASGQAIIADGAAPDPSLANGVNTAPDGQNISAAAAVLSLLHSEPADTPGVPQEQGSATPATSPRPRDIAALRKIMLGEGNAVATEPAALSPRDATVPPQSSPVAAGKDQTALQTANVVVVGREQHVAIAPSSATTRRASAPHAAPPKPVSAAPAAAGADQIGSPDGDLQEAGAAPHPMPTQLAAKEREDEGSAQLPRRGTAAPAAKGEPDDAQPFDQFATTAPVRQATQADGAPAHPPATLVQQVANAIVSAARPSPEARSAPADPQAVTPASTPSGIVKVLTIQLQPPELGTVAVRMALNGANLDVRLEVGRADTVALLQRDRDKLSDVLRSAGYHVDGMAVRIADKDVPGLGGQAPAGGFDASANQGQAGATGADARASEQRNQRQPEQVQQRPLRSDNGAEASDLGRVGTGIYL